MVHLNRLSNDDSFWPSFGSDDQSYLGSRVDLYPCHQHRSTSRRTTQYEILRPVVPPTILRQREPSIFPEASSFRLRATGPTSITAIPFQDTPSTLPSATPIFKKRGLPRASDHTPVTSHTTDPHSATFNRPPSGRPLRSIHLRP